MTVPPVDAVPEPEYPSPTIIDSRRLMGPNLMHASWGAVLDVALDAAVPAYNAQLVAAWHRRVASITERLRWPGAVTTERLYAGGASLFVAAPIDQLMTATDVSESAWVFAESQVAACGDASTLAHETDGTMAVLADKSRAEARHDLRALADEAARRGINITFDDTIVALGSGVGCMRWSIDALPPMDEILWESIHDIPIALVTGSNGKTTVVRMVAAMARADEHTVGYSCTDGVWIGDTQVERGDWSGPAGARRVLQDPSVTLAVLETARGGILRRGLAMQHAEAAAIVTLSADHFGGYGITDLTSLARAKFVVTHALGQTGTLIYNADVPELADVAVTYDGPRLPVRQPSVGREHDFLAQVPATLDGTAAHNMLNAAMALHFVLSLGLGERALMGLMEFGADPRSNLGRLMRYEVGGVTVIVDYAHNPQAVAALIASTAQLPVKRRAIVLGTGGDRDDGALRDIARAAVDSGVVSYYIAKEMPKFLRGRPIGSISAVMLDALQHLGVPADARSSAHSDLDAARNALEWAQVGDLVLLGVHDQREDVLALIERLQSSGWRAGSAVIV